MLLCPSATMSPFTSARVSTSTRFVMLTCSQPIRLPAVLWLEPASFTSATNRACRDAGASSPNLLAICAVVAGYPSCPLSSAIRAASLRRARRIFISAFLAAAAISSHHLPPQSRLNCFAPQLAQAIRRTPPTPPHTLPPNSLHSHARLQTHPQI